MNSCSGCRQQKSSHRGWERRSLSMPEWINMVEALAVIGYKLSAEWGHYGKVGRGKSLFCFLYFLSSFVRRFHPKAKLARLSMNLSVVSHYAWHGNYFHLQRAKGVAI